MSGLIWVAAAKVAMTPVQHTDGTSVPEYVCAPRLLVWRYADCSPSCSPEVVACTVGLGTYPVLGVGVKDGAWLHAIVPTASSYGNRVVEVLTVGGVPATQLLLFAVASRGDAVSAPATS